MKQRNFFYGLIIFGLSFLILTVLLFTVDRQTLTLDTPSVGLATMNQFFFPNNHFPVWDTLTDIIMIFALFIILIAAFIGFIQLVTRKHLVKVHPTILSLGIIVITMMIIWVVFDKGWVVNYRPILVEGTIESSYPSTHVMMATTIFLIFPTMVSQKRLRKLASLLSIGCITITILGRLLTKLHWFTDVIGGLIIGCFLFCLYVLLVDILKARITKKVI